MKPKYVKIVEVGPRDGLQNEPTLLTPAERAQLIDLLTATGLSSIEVGSFVSPTWVPQMDGTDEVLSLMHPSPQVDYPVLVPNHQGYERAMQAGAKSIAIFAAASESFSKKNTNCTIEEALGRYEKVADPAIADGMRLRGYVSCVQGCPIEGPISLDQVARVAEALYKMGCVEISLGDTIGTGTVPGVQAMIQKVSDVVPLDAIAVHFHDTYGQALVNIYAALEMGVHIVDSSILGLGGCPYAKGASGNVATEEVLQLLQGLDIKTGVDMTKLIDVGRFICHSLNINRSSKVFSALRG